MTAITAGAALLLMTPVAGAADEAALKLEMSRTLSSEQVRVSADNATLSRREPSVFSGEVEVEFGERRIIADEVIYNPASGRLSAQGNVRYADPRVELSGSQGEFETGLSSGTFLSAAFTLPARDGRGEAQQIWTRDDNILEMRGVSYTTCPVDNEDWVLLAPEVTLNRETGVGVGRGVRMKFKGVPILYAPYLSFPISDQRKSGFLVPDIGRSDSSGTDFSLPYYWNMAPNYDLVMTPRLLSKRGIQLGAHVRYLWPRTTGDVEIRYLPDDNLTGTSRSRSDLRHQTRFANGFRLDAKLQHVSDKQYFEDLGRSLGAASPTHLERRADVRYRNQHWRLLARAQSFQTLASNITEDNRPYQRLPQFLADGNWSGLKGSNFSFQAELVNFERRSGVTGLRVNLKPGLAWPMGGPGFSVTPSVELRHVQYQLANVEPGLDDSPSITAPVFSLDSRAVFERPAGQAGRLTQTLEPRLQYTHVPFRDQSNIPVFDTGEPDFNIVQLFRPNRFTGGDRLGDTDKLSIGVTSRLVNFAGGQEYLTATFGQAIFLSDRAVALPDGTAPGANASNFIGEIGMNFSRRWNADIGYQWDPDTTNSSKAEVRVQFKPDEQRVLNLAYRFRRDELEQSDVSFSWPLAKRWNLVGRWNFSLQDDRTLERFAGLEYETCCWIARMVSRNFINNLDGASDTALFAQIHFKGLASIGGRADLLLEDGILGY